MGEAAWMSIGRGGRGCGLQGRGRGGCWGWGRGSVGKWLGGWWGLWWGLWWLLGGCFRRGLGFCFRAVVFEREVVCLRCWS